MKQSAPPTHEQLRDASTCLLAFLEKQPNHELRAGDWTNFYSQIDESVKKTISNANIDGHARGIRSLCGAFPDVLAYRTVVCDKKPNLDSKMPPGHKNVVVARVVDLEHADPTTRMASRLAMLRSGFRNNGSFSMAALNDELAVLKEELGSMNKMKEAVQQRGICLGDGSEHHGWKQLKKALKFSKAPMVKLSEAKKFEFAKKCLVEV